MREVQSLILYVGSDLMAKGIDDYLVLKEKENSRPMEDIIIDLKGNAKSFEDFINPDHTDEIKRALSVVKLPKEKMNRIANIVSEKCHIHIVVDTGRSMFDGDMRCDVNKWLTEEPPELKYIFKDLLVCGIVAGLMSQGGTGKSYLELYWAISCTTGQTIFKSFVPSKPMKVMVLFGEDDENIVWRRFRWILADLEKQGISIDRDLLIKNLYCGCGISAPLMELDGANPQITSTYMWLRREVKRFQPGLIIIDPKAQFFGLEENSNDYNTQWVNSLKNLTRINDATILFSHHVTKLDAKSLEATASRGGSALTDNCRWVANMRLMDKIKATSFGIDNSSKYVEFKVSKNNYAELMQDPLYFKKGENGLLKLADLKAHKIVDITNILKGILRQDKFKLTVDQLANRPTGKEVRERIKAEVGYKIDAKEIERAINNGINEGVFELAIRVKPGGKGQAGYLVLKENYQS